MITGHASLIAELQQLGVQDVEVRASDRHPNTWIAEGQLESGKFVFALAEDEAAALRALARNLRRAA